MLLFIVFLPSLEKNSLKFKMCGLVIMETKLVIMYINNVTVIALVYLQYSNNLSTVTCVNYI